MTSECLSLAADVNKDVFTFCQSCLLTDDVACRSRPLPAEDEEDED